MYCNYILIFAESADDTAILTKLPEFNRQNKTKCALNTCLLPSASLQSRRISQKYRQKLDLLVTRNPRKLSASNEQGGKQFPACCIMGTL